MAKLISVQTVLTNTAATLDRASTALNKLQAALAKTHEFASSQQLQRRKDGHNSYAERGGISDHLKHEVEKVELGVGQLVRVTTDKDKYERECRYCHLQISECIEHKLGLEGSVISVDESDGTVKVDNHIGWVPARCLMKVEPLATNSEQKPEQEVREVNSSAVVPPLASIGASSKRVSHDGLTPAEVFQKLHEMCESRIAQYMSVRNFHAAHTFITAPAKRHSVASGVSMVSAELSESLKPRRYSHTSVVRPLPGAGYTESYELDFGIKDLPLLNGRTPVEVCMALNQGSEADPVTRDTTNAGAAGDSALDFNLYSQAGSYVLSVFRNEHAVSEQRGGYTFDKRSGRIQDDAGGWCGCFSTQGMPLSFAIPEDGGFQPFKCITVTNSEIMVEIQKSTNDNAFFVLPSQLNGAEYQSFEKDYIVKDIDDYQWDNTGGPRGQLAVHPAAGQFVLDNAANDIRPDGISAVASVIKEVKEQGYNFELQNGYLKVPGGGASQAIEAWKTALKKFKMLVMEDVPASGLTPDKAGFSAATHRVNLVYASAVPVQTYNNLSGDRGVQIQVAASTLVAQYYGALSIAARRGTPTSPKVVYLMPLGGGVFENPPEIIVKGMSLAMEMLSQEELKSLDVHILTFHRNAAEVQEFKRLLGVFQKLNDSAN